MMMSIIVAAYNVEKYIKRCLDSLIAQTLDDFEIIVVNDSSTDRTLMLVTSYMEENRNIVIIDKAINEGLSEARNSGLRLAKGKYVAFVDGDDFVEKETYQECCEFCEKYALDEAVFESTYDRSNKEKLYMQVDATRTIYSTPEERKLYFEEMVGSLPDSKSDYQIGYTPWGRIYRRNILLENGIYFVSERKLIYEDLLFALNATPHMKKIGILKKPFYHYCENISSLTTAVRPDRYDRVKQMYLYLKNTVPYRDMLFREDNVNLRFRRTMLSYIRLCIMQLAMDKRHKDKIKHILTDDFCCEVLRDYPVMKLPAKQAVFAMLLKYKLYFGLQVILKLYGKAKK